MNKFIIHPDDVKRIMKSNKTFICFNTDLQEADGIRRQIIKQIIFTDNYTRYYNYTSTNFRLLDDVKKQLKKGILIN